jgi:hypothetical protein
MSKEAELFHVRNSDWAVNETAPGVYELATADGSQKIGGLSGPQLAAAQAVVAALDRYIREVGGG